MTNAYFALCAGTDPADLVNIEDIISEPPNVLRSMLANFLGSVKNRALSGHASRDGAVNIEWPWDSMTHTDDVTLLNQFFGGGLTESFEGCIATLDRQYRYSVFTVDSIDMPQSDEGEQNFEVVNDYWLENYRLPMFGLNWATTAISANTTITASQRVILADTSAGDVTVTLPAASAPNANTPFSFWKQAAANSLIIQRAGSDTFAPSGTSITLTALDERAEIFSDGVSLWTRISP